MFKDGDILLCKSNGLIPSLIKWGTDSIYSHVAVVASARLGLLIEAIPEGGVRAIALENYKTSFDLFRVKETYSFNLSGVISYLIRMLAKKYDFKSTIRLGWKLALRRFNLFKLASLKLAKNKQEADTLQEDNDFFCSELCYEAFYLGGGLDIVPKVGDSETVSPGDISKSSVVEMVTV